MSTSVALALASFQLAALVELVLIVYLLRRLRDAREELVEARCIIEQAEAEIGSRSDPRAGSG